MSIVHVTLKIFLFLLNELKYGNLENLELF